MERVLPDWAADDQEHVVWLDDDNAITWTYAKGDSEPNGGLHWHRKKEVLELSATPGWCVGGFYIKPEGNPAGAPMWTLESKEPVTVSPSLLCRSCGQHGFIRGGKWIGA